MGGGDVLGTATIFTALTGAIVWLGKRYIDSLERRVAGCETREAALQKVIDDRAAEAVRLSDERAKENALLREEVAAMKARTGVAS